MGRLVPGQRTFLKRRVLLRIGRTLGFQLRNAASNKSRVSVTTPAPNVANPTRAEKRPYMLRTARAKASGGNQTKS
jgi:hypothetical protein